MLNQNHSQNIKTKSICKIYRTFGWEICRCTIKPFELVGYVYIELIFTWIMWSCVCTVGLRFVVRSERCKSPANSAPWTEQALNNGPMGHLLSVIITNPISKSTEEIACGSACGITDLITLITWVYLLKKNILPKNVMMFLQCFIFQRCSCVNIFSV